MIVHGYTNKLDLVKVELPTSKILKSGIDPWRLDLFDPAPIKMTLHGEEINFRRLRDISFAYYDTKDVFICMHDGERSIAVTGDAGMQAVPWECLSGLRVSDRPFGDHFETYLKMFSRKWGEKPLRTTLMYNRSWARTIECMAFPHTSSHVVLSGDTIGFGDRVGANGIVTSMFLGDMFSERRAPAKLSPQINWIFEKFGDCEPVVYGVAVANCTWRTPKPTPTIDMLVAKEHQEAMLYRLVALGLEPLDWECPYTQQNMAKAFRFKRENLVYTVRAPAAEQPLADFRKHGQLSPACLYSSAANEVRGSRLAFFDAGCRRSRSIANYWDLSEWQTAHQCSNSKLLKESGFRAEKPFQLA